MHLLQLIIAVDGKADDEVVEASTKLKNNGVVIFCIGLGHHADKAEIKIMASDPDDKHVITLEYDDLDPDAFVQFLDAANCAG